ncbi:hypothetical protein QTP88_008982 [Uroleucon formosanum]
MEKYQKNIWVVNPFQDAILTGISIKADEELIDISEDTSLKLKFRRNHLIEFWLSAQQKCPTLSTEALKVLLPFSSSHLCEIGFSVMLFQLFRSEITKSGHIEINDLVTEETFHKHDLVSEQSISSNQYIGYEKSGRRIVDMNYVFYQIKNSDHKAPFGCSFLNMTFISEKKHGLRSTFKFKCDICHIIMFIDSEKSKPERYLPINEAAVTGSISTGIEYTQLSELCATMDIPCMASYTFVLVQGFINKIIHDVAEIQMKIAGDEKRRLAIEAGSVDIDGIPMCTVVADGQWSKRSYKTKYDALSGVKSICVICQKAKNKKLNPPEHTCFLNWKKGATSMEADGVADGFKQSLEMHGLKYNKLIGNTKLFSKMPPPFKHNLSGQWAISIGQVGVEFCLAFNFSHTPAVHSVAVSISIITFIAA